MIFRNKIRWTSLIYEFIILFLIIFSLLPIELINSINFPKSEEKTNEQDIPNYFRIPKLMREEKYHHPDYVDTNDQSNSSSDSRIDYFVPDCKIGPQIGIGGGNFLINEYSNLSNSESLQLIDSSIFANTHTDSFNIIIPDGYSNTTGWFNITNVSSLSDWRHIENDRNGDFKLPSDQVSPPDFEEVAMEFSVVESFFNLSSVRIYLTLIQSSGEEDPTGEILIVNGTWNSAQSRWEPDTSDVLGSTSLLAISGWRTYSFGSDITLKNNRHYYIVLNDTTTTDAIWEWGAQKDPAANDAFNDSEDEGWFFFKNNHGGIWYDNVFTEKYDLNLRIQGTPVEFNGSSYTPKIYYTPQSLNFIYNNSLEETPLSNFLWFEWNGTSNNIHRFYTNTSVSFDLSWIVNISSNNNPIPFNTSFLTLNGSMSQWYLYFTTTTIATSNSINNRTISITELPDDWNATIIYLNGSIDFNTTSLGGLNSSISYLNQSKSMMIKSSSIDAFYWNISFQAPNYFYKMEISRESSILNFPYEINATDILEIEFQVGYSGNITYWIDSPDGSNLLSKQNINSTHTVFSDLWDVNSTISQTTEINGSYQIQAFWRSPDELKVGTYTRKIDIFVNTSLTVSFETKIIIGQLFNISSIYKSLHNSSNVLNAQIICKSNWTSDTYMNQLPDLTYNASFKTTGRLAGEIGELIITTQVRWFVNWTTVINVKFIEDSFLSINATKLFLQWRENTTLMIEFNSTSSERIIDANISFNGDLNNFFEDYGIYLYKLNSTDYPGIGTYINLKINASHTNYVSQETFINLTITPGKTDVICNYIGLPISNLTEGVVIPYSNYSSDDLFINFQYYSSLIGDTINTDTVFVASSLPYINPLKETNLTWTLEIRPNMTGNYLINVTFSANNYNTSSFIFNLTLVKAQTNLPSNVESPSFVYYNEYEDFYIIYNNTDYNESITGLTLGSGIEINNTKVSFLNRTGIFYWFRLNPLNLDLGTHESNITFSHSYFKTASIIIQFEIITHPTNLLASHLSEQLINDTTVLEYYFANSSNDAFEINLAYLSAVNSSLLDISMPKIESDLSITRQIEESNLSWTITINPNQTGIFIINITFSHPNFQSMMFILHVSIYKANTEIYSSLAIDKEIYYSENLDFFLIYNNTNYNENITGLTLGNGININNSNIIFLNRTGAHYWFRIISTLPALGHYFTNISFYHSYFQNSSIIISFQIIPRLTTISAYYQGFEISNNTSIITIYFSNSTADLLIINSKYLDLFTSTILNTSSFTVNSFLEITDQFKEANNTWTIKINPNGTGIFLVNLSFSTPNYEKAIFIIKILVEIAQTAILTNYENSTHVYYAETVEFYLIYRNINYNENITGLTLGDGISINNTKISFSNRTGDLYWFKTSSEILLLGEHVSTITFSHEFFSKAEIQVIFEIVIHPTIIMANQGLIVLENDSTIIQQIYANSSADFIITNLDYMSSVNNSILNVNTPLIESKLEIIGVIEELNSSWTIIINPNQTGLFLVNITFVAPNYQLNTFILRLNVSKAPTKILQLLPSEIPVYYNLSYSFYLSYSNSEYNENITGLTVGDGISINDTQVLFLYRSSDQYWFELHQTTFNVGIHFINITFNHSFFEEASINICFNILARITGLTGIDATNGTLIINNSAVYYRYYSKSNLNNITFELRYFDEWTNTTITPDSITVNVDISVFYSYTMNSTTGYWFFIFNGSMIGEFIIEIQFELLNFESIIFILKYSIEEAESYLSSSILPIPFINDVQTEKTLIFNIIWLSVYNEALNASNGILINNSSDNSDLKLLYSNWTNGNHTFSYLKTSVGIFTYNLTFILENYTIKNHLICFNVYNRTMIIDYEFTDLLNSSTIDTLQYGEEYYFNVYLKDNDTLNWLNSTISCISIYISYLGIINSGNHSFRFTASLIGNFSNILISFILSNYLSIKYTLSFEVKPRVMVLDNNLTSPQKIDFLEYGDIIYFYVYLNDSRTQNSLNISQFSDLPSDIYFENFTEKRGHLFRYNALQIGIHLFSINFSLNNYLSYDHLINFTTTYGNCNLFTNSSTLSTYYSLNIDFSVLWYKIPNVLANGSFISTIENTTNIEIIPSSANWQNLITIDHISNGNYSFLIEAVLIGSFTLEIRFSSILFQPFPVIIFLEIVVDQLSTEFISTQPTNNTIWEDQFYYTQEREVKVTWIDSVYKDGLVDLSPSYSGSGLDYVELLVSYSNGTHIFRIEGRSMGTFSLIITLETLEYAPICYVITFTVKPMPTFLPKGTIEANLTIGQYLTISIIEWPTIFNESVPISILILRNQTIILTQKFFENPVTDYEFQYNSSSFNKGNYNLSLHLSSYGYINQTVFFTLTVKGRRISISSIDINPEELIQGLDLIIFVTIEIESLYSISNDNGGNGASLVSLEGLKVNFDVWVDCQNGSCSFLPHSTSTNQSGIAFFLISGKITKYVSKIHNMSISIEETPSTEGSSYEMPQNILETLIFNKRTSSNNDLMFLFFLITILLIGGFSATYSVLKIRKTDKEELGLIKPIKTEEKVEIETKTILEPFEDLTIKVEELKEDRKKKIEIGSAEWLKEFPESYSEFENELKYLFQLVESRKGRWVGRTSYNFLTKNAPEDISVKSLKVIYQTIAIETIFFTKQNTGIVITEEGKQIAKKILNDTL